MYTVVFDARNAGLPGWELIAGGLFFVALTYYIRSSPPREKLGTAALSRPVRNAMFIFACAWTAVATISTIGSTMRVRYRLNHGDYVVVEGSVSDFVPGDWGGHREELWHVRSGDEDHWYHYKPSVVTAGYRQTQPQGGPIRDGVRVRIADMDGLIARLEVATSDLPAAP